MAVEQMKYVSMLGPLNLFNEFVLKHVVNSNVQLEPSYKALNIAGLIPFEEETTFENLKKRMRFLNEKYGIRVRELSRDEIDDEVLKELNLQEFENFVKELEDRISDHRKQTDLYKVDIQEREQILKQIQPLAEVEVDIDQMFHFSFMKFRFGTLPRDTYQKQREYLEGLDVMVVPVSEENDNVWLSYFMPISIAPVIDNVFTAIGFERVRISDQAKGMPKITIKRINDEIANLKRKINQEDLTLKLFLEEKREAFEAYYNKILYLSKISDIKLMGAHTKETFFLTGWIPMQDFKRFQKEVEPMDSIIFSSEDPEYVVSSTPPTILKNNKFFKPFESLVTMYGLPIATELDPTALMTFTYVLMFGFMFGDVGQGLLIALAGLYMKVAKKLPFGGILLYVGVSSTIFGFVYGSVFGSEEFVHPLWASPLHGKDTINSILYIAVAYGAFIIITTIIANIINNIRMRKWGRLLFDKNGLAGLLFYGGLAAVIVVSLITGKFALTGIVLFIVVVLPMLLIFFKEPLENLIMKRDHIMPHEKGMYLVEASFELFETLLSFFSGTVSFARVGAFALNHAGLSLAVWTLYNMMHGVGGIIIVIIGNIVTIGLEGLIVGIQCMRLEFYEMFGRFYIGEGQEFKPVRVTDE
ncbi:MAG: V-type ATP synthase subunit I [Clostridia bacterium]|nr:V-type ATP synthase subunit I [Clostridia bacterium]